MLIISIEIMKIINERESVIQGVLLWDEVTAKCNENSKRCW